MCDADVVKWAAYVQRARGLSLLFVAPLILFGACERNATIAESVVDLAVVLPANAPYIIGTIGSVDVARARVLVERSPGVLESGALVGVHSAQPIFWRDGRRGSLENLQVGRVVTVWVSGAELRSLPPQVSASAIVIER